MRGDIKPLEIMARREEWSEGVSLYGRQVIEGHSVAKVDLVTLTTTKPGDCHEPFLKLGIQEAQNLMDELWQCGLRPSEGSGSAGSLRATEKHLEDMRVIAMKKLNIDV